MFNVKALQKSARICLLAVCQPHFFFLFLNYYHHQYLSESFCFQAFWIVAQVLELLCYT